MLVPHPAPRICGDSTVSQALSTKVANKKVESQAKQVSCIHFISFYLISSRVPSLTCFLKTCFPARNACTGHEEEIQAVDGINTILTSGA